MCNEDNYIADMSLNNLFSSFDSFLEWLKLFIKFNFIITFKYFVQYLKLYLAVLLPAGRISNLE